MRYPELDGFDSTPDQDLALTIRFKQDTQSPARSVGDYLRLIVISILDGEVERHVLGVQAKRLTDGFKAADQASRLAAAAPLGVDLTIDVPRDDAAVAAAVVVP